MAVAEIDLIQVQLEDSFLGIGPLDPFREDQPGSCGPRFYPASESSGGQLLRDGAGALRRTTVPDVRERRRRDTDEVEPVMVVEALVLDRDERTNEVGRNLGERNVALFLKIVNASRSDSSYTVVA
jgi:hypothetical protein